MTVRHTFTVTVDTADLDLHGSTIGEYIRLAIEEHGPVCDMDLFEGLQADVSLKVSETSAALFGVAA
ncbi:MAG: hypothetical protein ACOVKC_03200 [Brevundimonas sp.]